MTGYEHSQSLTILNTKVRRDAEGRYCLNDCHKAAGGEKTHQPANWLRLDQTQALIEEIGHSSEVRSDPLYVQNGGRNPGTYVAKELVYAYAMWINPAFHLTVIRAFDAMVSGAEARTARVSVAPVFRGYMSIAKAVGLDLNQAALAADRATRITTGVSPLGNLGITHLLAPQQDLLLTPRDLGARLDGKSAIAVNQMLSEAGLQEGHRDAKGRGYWEPTEKGREFAVILDTGKKHGDGTPVRQVKWNASVLDLLQAGDAGQEVLA
jgi:hypothetical protein